MRYSFIAAGIIGAIILCWRYATHETITRWVDASSFDSEGRTITIYTDAQAKVYRVQPNSNLMIGDRRISPDQIRRKYKIETEGATPDQKTLVQLKLVELPRRMEASQVRQFLLGIVFVEFAVILLIVTNAAASTVTREKEDGTLDLLLSTPITSRYYIWGKLRGLVSYVLPLVAVPAISVCIFVIYDFVMAAFGAVDPDWQWLVSPEAIFILPATFTIVAAFAAILGMQMSLRCRTTVMAVMSSVGIVVGICGTLGWCGFTLLERSRNEFNVVIASFSPFTVLAMLIDPLRTGAEFFDVANAESSTARFMVMVASLLAVGAYTGVVWAMYSSMVKNFDMTIRRQSR
jgi:ABC-type Na+ efflux pump permease subunit